MYTLDLITVNWINKEENENLHRGYIDIYER